MRLCVICAHWAQGLSGLGAPGDILSQNRWCDSSAHCSRHGRSLPH